MNHVVNGFWILCVLLGPTSWVSGFQGMTVLQPHNIFGCRKTGSRRKHLALKVRETSRMSTRSIGTDLQKKTDEFMPVPSQDQSISSHAGTYNSTEAINEALSIHCNNMDTKSALQLLLSIEEISVTSSFGPDATSYIVVMKGLLADDRDPEELAELLERMSSFCKVPTAAYNLVISAWAASTSEEAPERADELLDTLWSLYNASGYYTLMPNRATYMGVMTAHSRRGNGEVSALRTEELLEEMDIAGAQHPTLQPTAAFVNVVLSAWSRSRSAGAVERCKAIIARMEELALSGREELAPSTVSFNALIDAMARRNKPNEGEELLVKMDELSQKHSQWACKPDSVSFNTVLKGWAKCTRRGSAERAEDILKHMESRHKNKATDVAPDEASYANVIHAWSRSRDPNAASRSHKVFQQMERAFESGNLSARPGTMTYNTMIDVLSKCGDESAPTRALELIAEMKSKQIARDVFTYTSAINVMAKAESARWSDKAEELLDEMMQEQRRTRRSDLKPNVRTFTSVINAVARSKERPERALAILERMRDANVDADSICYNAVINAYGWSNVVGKAESAFQLLQEMLQPGSKAKPDIITANSILHSCAFAVTDSQAQRGKVMECAIQTLEIFNRDAPSYGWPDHITFSNMLLTIAKQMPLNEKRVSLAEATFWQCCEVGHVSSLVVQRLRLAIPAERLAYILGSAIVKNTESSFIFNMKDLPAEWQVHAPRPGRRKASRASEKKGERQCTKENKHSS